LPRARYGRFDRGGEPAPTLADLLAGKVGERRRSRFTLGDLYCEPLEVLIVVQRLP
jgi:hypothetical protein